MTLLRRLLCALRGHDPNPTVWIDESPDGDWTVPLPIPVARTLRREGRLRPCRRCPAYVRVAPL